MVEIAGGSSGDDVHEIYKAAEELMYRLRGVTIAFFESKRFNNADMETIQGSAYSALLAEAIGISIVAQTGFMPTEEERDFYIDKTCFMLREEVEQMVKDLIYQQDEAEANKENS